MPIGCIPDISIPLNLPVFALPRYDFPILIRVGFSSPELTGAGWAYLFLVDGKFRFFDAGKLLCTVDVDTCVLAILKGLNLAACIGLKIKEIWCDNQWITESLPSPTKCQWPWHLIPKMLRISDLAQNVYFRLITCAREAGNKINIGVCYGMDGNNLPYAPQVVSLYKKYGIEKIRLFDPKPEVLTALMGSKIQGTLGVPNKQIRKLADSEEASQTWLATNIFPYFGDIEFNYIVVGNKAFPGEFGPYVVPAILNIRNVLHAHGLNNIEVTTVIDTTAVLAISYPPSAAVFTAEADISMSYLLQSQSEVGAHIMLNVYPYFTYAADPTNVRLDYVQFTAKGPVVHDGNLSYWNLYDAMVDAFIWAMEKKGFPNVPIIIGETGWPSAGNGNLTTPELAWIYNKNFIKHVMNSTGTPKRPKTYNDAHIFAMFNENLKPAGAEQHFGLFYPDMKPIYPIFP
ncbi:probable glucan endo-1,3-beta-glucosidase BG4 [Telopea speciosissima]|uniref:probable glucan endo-1,3-beta-glucosidase BG4 n=1 Tax=Telopea speciosissima TaxID=54955 RepID=UPI001CC560DD|nr:probable glucan endo-1,3-beta-glucosidase BG4 [Telopea speciosissima]